MPSITLLPFEFAPETAQRQHHAIDGAREALFLVGECVEDADAGFVQFEEDKGAARRIAPDPVGIRRDDNIEGTGRLTTV